MRRPRGRDQGGGCAGDHGRREHGEVGRRCAEPPSASGSYGTLAGTVYATAAAGTAASAPARPAMITSVPLNSLTSAR